MRDNDFQEDKPSTTRWKGFVRNLSSNWFLPLSTAAYGCVEFFDSFVFWVGLALAVTATTLFAGFIQPIAPWEMRQRKIVRFVALFAACGICWAAQQYGYSAWNTWLLSSPFVSGLPFDLTLGLSLVLAVSSFPLAYFGSVYVWRIIWNVGEGTLGTRSMSYKETIAYVILAAIMLRFAASVYLSSNAFYGRQDVIYSFDSPALDATSEYLRIRLPASDLRQPLFGIFSAPIMAIPYLVTSLLLLPWTATAILMNSVQIVLLVFSFILLGNALKLRGITRFCWVLFCCSTYTGMIFTLVMEQYIIAFFWLCMVVHELCNAETHDVTIYWAAGGTTLISLVYLPFASRWCFKENPRAWLKDLFRNALGFGVLMIAFFRFDVIYTLHDRVAWLLRFSGQDVTWYDKALQSVEFPWNCLAAPTAGSVFESQWYGDGWHWLVTPPSVLSWPGYLVLILTVLSAVLNWKRRSCRVAAIWVLTSFATLFVLGWGTAEGVLNLYALYFCWGYFMLLFALVQKLGNGIRWRWLLPTVAVCFSLYLVMINAPAIQELCTLASQYYPA